MNLSCGSRQNNIKRMKTMKQNNCIHDNITTYHSLNLCFDLFVVMVITTL